MVRNPGSIPLIASSGFALSIIDLRLLPEATTIAESKNRVVEVVAMTTATTIESDVDVDRDRVRFRRRTTNVAFDRRNIEARGEVETAADIIRNERPRGRRLYRIRRWVYTKNSACH